MKLTDKELQVLGMVADGFRPKEIGVGLGMSPRTVETHLNMIKAKLGAKTLPHMIRLAQKEKIIE